MKVTATLDEQLKIVYDVLTSGMPYFVDYGFRLDYNNTEYAKARKVLQDASGEDKRTICIEDIQIQMIRMGFSLTFTDVEGDGDNTKALNLTQLESNWDKVPLRVIGAMVSDWDAGDADLFMQWVLFGQVIYG
jgi:hypothetical protein